jgi:alpha/beta superfamily hydrolase
MAGEIKSIFVRGPAGRLEALLNTGEPNASHAALVCHPHPLYGGTMHNKVVFAAMKALNGLGFPALRFNFRGAGRSEGKHDRGRGEMEDVKAALDWLDNEFHLPIIFTGFSFGAVTGMRVCCPDQRVKALISLGTPVEAEDRLYSYEFLAQCTKPKLFISGNQDQYGPRPQLEHMFALAAQPKEFVWIEGAEHFFEGKLEQVRATIARWAQKHL